MEPVSRGTKGAQFRKSDLHVHTPGSYDYEEDISAEELVDEFIEHGLELVVAADHNEPGWYENIRSEAEQREQPLEILPGVEITTPQGGDNQIHLVAVFPPENSDEIAPLLHNISIDTNDPSATQASSSIPDICDEIRSRGGLAILAHIDENSGALKETERGNIRDKIFDPERVAAIEVVDKDTKDEFPEFPAVKSSDAHRPDQLGRGYTYLKMTEPSFEGFQTALSDPASRIRFSRPNYDHGKIKGIRFEGDFLNGRAVQVSPNLNCLIGGKGTGKSTVIEQIRYAFDITPDPDRIKQDYETLVQETLGPDGEVQVHVETEDGEQYWICRSYGDEPVIYRGDGTETDLHIKTFRGEFFDLEIHSQGELLELARDTSDQLELIDSYLNFDGKKRKRETVKSNLRNNAQKLQSAREELDRLKSEITDYEAVRENLAVMKESGVEEFLDDQDAWDDEETRLNRLDSALDEILTEIPEDEDITEMPTNEMGDSPNQELIQDAESVVQEARSDILTLLNDVRNRIEAAQQSLNQHKSEWEDLNSSRQEKYEDLEEDIREETGVDIQEYFDVKEQASELDTLEEELEEQKDKIEEIEEDRRDLWNELKDVRRQITDIRRAGISDINQSLNNIRVRLEPDGNRESFINWFNDVLKGSNVRTQDKEKIAKEYTPRTLFDIIQSKDIDKLVDDTGITDTAAENIVGFENLRNQLHELQIQELHDEPVIEIKHESTWKSLDEMSDGQKCTALLSIAMMERDKPLIVDQPEDMLDNEYIYDEVVDASSQVKKSRQIIAATHNANIPILGDAEKINVMDSNGHQGFIHERGSIDDPDVRKRAKKILEGGEEAFNERTQKYGALQMY